MSLGYWGQTFSKLNTSFTFTCVSQRIYHTPFYMFAGETITGLVLGGQGGGSVLTLAKQAVMSADAQTILGITADNSAGSPNWGTVGIKLVNLITPYTADIDRIVQIAFLFVGTSLPIFTVGHGSGRGDMGTKAGATTSTAAHSTSLQTDLIVCPINSDGNAVPFWVGLI